MYSSQFNGDFDLWLQQKHKTLIVNKLITDRRGINFIARAREFFDRVIVTADSDDYFSYFLADARLGDFAVLKIEPLTHSQQEQLIPIRSDYAIK